MQNEISLSDGKFTMHRRTKVKWLKEIETIERSLETK